MFACAPFFEKTFQGGLDALSACHGGKKTFKINVGALALFSALCRAQENRRWERKLGHLLESRFDAVCCPLLC